MSLFVGHFLRFRDAPRPPGSQAGKIVSDSSSSTSSEAAKRYAAAVFDLALDTGEVDAVEAGLTALAKTIEGDAALSRAMKSPLHAAEDKAGVLALLSEKLGLPDLARRAAGVAALNRRAGDLPAIARAFAERAALHRGATHVLARVARPISNAQTLDLESAVSSALGRKVSVEVEVDPALIGGLQLRMGSRVIDASVRTRLNSLTNLMKGA